VWCDRRTVLIVIGRNNQRGLVGHGSHDSRRASASSSDAGGEVTIADSWVKATVGTTDPSMNGRLRRPDQSHRSGSDHRLGDE
jgi:hypothetical protein